MSKVRGMGIGVMRIKVVEGKEKRNYRANDCLKSGEMKRYGQSLAKTEHRRTNTKAKKN